EHAVACDNYTWHGTTYTASTNTPVHSEPSALGCDSTHRLDLIINTSSAEIETVTVCDSYTWHGTMYTASIATPTFTTTNAAGCDSVTTLHLTVNYSNSAVETITACDSYTWQGNTYTVSTHSPTFTTTNAAGCDSVTNLHLTVNYSNSAVETVTACNSFLWHGIEYTASTSTPTYTTENVAGCDSVTALHLTINACSTTEITACDSYTWRATTYTASGRYIAGNDTLVLTVNHSNSAVETATACDSYTWHGTVYTASTATPTFTTTNAAGCDSVTTLHLTVNYSSSAIESTTACDSYTWHGTSYAVSTSTPTFTTTNAAGCDSVVTLHLTIKHSSSVVETVTACDSFTWHGTTYATGGNGIATYSTSNAVGCDSTVTLNLSINHSTTGDTSVTACDNFTWGGTTYTSSGVYSLGTSLTNAAGCDSTAILHLTVVPSTHDTVRATICDNESYLFEDSTYTTSGIWTFQSTSQQGCDSLRTLMLTVQPTAATSETVAACDSWQGFTTDTTLVYILATVNGCDSIHTINVSINHSTDTTVFDSTTGEYEWHGVVYTESGTYTWTGTTAVGCDSTVTLILTINSAGIPFVESDNSGIRVYPNPTSGQLSVDADDEVSRVEVYDLTGRKVKLFDRTTVVDLDGLPSGSYTLRIHLRHGTALRRVILR
ncbi:MAG: T9SS type A sorting domain-containing protein, partial [Bacteroidales bacterium]|nr:T9SS type A sorting domain-containing protein [Bacteroidales bacterium]